jgi:hypothetical protein
VTPSFDAAGNIIGYHSSRRTPDRAAVEKIKPIYAELLRIESRASDWRTGMEAATAHLGAQLESLHMPYDQFVFSLAS